ncbi:MAG: hypothetical protein JWN74_2039 [Acidobacteriaceae bacterium]|nr:hypothetical protein [Acidobacteriaceae bacterium]
MVKMIVQGDLANCDDEQLAVFREHKVEPYFAPIVRYGKTEAVVIVARRGREVIYWEDVEEGFNVSPVAPNDRILEHSCNQDNLGLALNAWIKGRTRPPRLGPATQSNTNSPH